MEPMNTTQVMSFILLLGIVLMVSYVLYGVKKEYEKMQAGNAIDINEESELRDVEIVLYDGTLYERYENVLRTRFSERVYNLHTIKGGQKELLVKLHLGEGMMLKAVVARKES